MMRMNHRHLAGLVRNLNHRVRMRPGPLGAAPENRRQPGRRGNRRPRQFEEPEPGVVPIPDTPRREVPLEPVPFREIADNVNDEEPVRRRLDLELQP